MVAGLPHKQTRVLTGPLVTVFGFIAQPETHMFLKPKTMRAATHEYGLVFHYEPPPSRTTYQNFLECVRVARRNLRNMQPRDMIDLQSFLWVLGSDEYKS